jgi:hypothetical protein
MTPCQSARRLLPHALIWTSLTSASHPAGAARRSLSFMHGGAQQARARPSGRGHRRTLAG